MYLLAAIAEADKPASACFFQPPTWVGRDLGGRLVALLASTATLAFRLGG